MKKKAIKNNPKKVFITRYTSEGHFPKRRDIYFIDNPAVRHLAYYEKGLGFVKNQWSKDKIAVQWWLEEKEFPDNDEIKIVSQSMSNHSASQFIFSSGIKWLIDDLLADRVRD